MVSPSQPRLCACARCSYRYVGAYLSQLGFMLLVTTPATINAGIVPVALWWGAMYTFSSVVEASGDKDAE